MGRVPDLSTLNPAEREALALLAQGHTAKSIASITGRSVGSINERLREARRKTGVGSSRELARLFAAQENRDEQIGVAPGFAAKQALLPTPARRGVWTKGLAVMLIFALGATLTTALLAPAPQTAPAADPLLDGVVGKAETTAPRLHERVRAEKRDAAWAPRAEARLRTAYAHILGVGGEPLRVICAATLCEVTGTITAQGEKDINATMQALQGTSLSGEVRAQGFGDALMHGFGGEVGAKQTRFVTYWIRRER
ncbi:helix-turn-helix domain-containing protein [Sphingomonas sp. Root241]|uniref:helix-turn-helix domain-containing protein n=1 Tax=Sphingomonas sp. Root241 TaxID=1736501 RepID=UPI000701AB4C|nr:helix-turn-helix transcriptional regulator [Sphingomonas sp. Root241]KRC81490.1 hypothetical protein ASE13_03645 [Sphingomonas sp. Root241]